ncbi:MAG: Amt family ammonium transporter [Planctomycetota bacterium]|jgi:Amt family ammonium transporter
MRLTFLILFIFAAATRVSYAQGDNVGTEFNTLDTVWVLLAAFLVFFMQAGFGMVEAGLVRAKNAGNVLMKNVLDFSFASLGYFLCGYAIMFGGDGPLFGTEGWALINAKSAADGVPVEAFWLFQAVFAGAAATIVAGAVAERMKFVAYLIYSFLISALIYPVVGHWVWGGGWLAEMDFHDFAGSTVVHGVGGISALIGAWLLGPRFGRFNKDGTANAIAGHSLPLVTIGVFILWFGWYGFNVGSSLSAGDPQLLSRIAINTTLAPAIGTIAAMALAWKKFGKPDLTIALNGALAGLVGITAPCAVVTPLAALAIGAIAGVLVVLGIDLLNKVKIDDPVGAFPVHGLCGIWGTLAVGIFGQEALGAPNDGLFAGGGFSQLGVQALGIVACLGFTAIAMLIVFKLIDATVGLRVSHETELRGLDLDEHGLDSYAGFQIFTTD